MAASPYPNGTAVRVEHLERDVAEIRPIVAQVPVLESQVNDVQNDIAELKSGQAALKTGQDKILQAIYGIGGLVSVATALILALSR